MARSAIVYELPVGENRTFDDFYRTELRGLVASAVAIGASVDEALEAADATMEEVLRRWDVLVSPTAYARRAVISNFVKQRLRDRQRLPRTIAGGHLTPEAAVDDGLTMWEDQQWVDETLRSLPPAQAAVVRHLVDGLTTGEIAGLLGKTPAAVRKNLQMARARLRESLCPEGNRE